MAGLRNRTSAGLARDRTKEPLVVIEVREGTKQDRSPSPFRHDNLYRCRRAARVLCGKRDADRRRPVHERVYLLPENRQHGLSRIAGFERPACDAQKFTL